MVGDWAREGIPLRFCDAADVQKATEPEHERKVQGVTAALRGAHYGAAASTQLMQGHRPGSVVLGNMVQSEPHWRFVSDTIAKNERRRALIRWPKQLWGRRPR